MTWLMHQKPAGELKVVFANTGEEHPRTLAFVHRFSRHFGIDVVWVEALVDPREGFGIRHRVVDYRTASRNGEPFEAMIAKYGLPSSSRPFCSKYLKNYPIVSYLRSIGWEPGTYDTAIGIRGDEADRIAHDQDERRILYPLLKAKIKKADVLTWWEQQPFDLSIREHEGNCKWCWKKSMRKHLTLINESPEFFDFPRRMEQAYDQVRNKPGEPPKRMFRGKRSVDDLFELAKLPFDAFEEEEFERSNGCSESCEAF